MRFLSFIKTAEHQGSIPKGLEEAMGGFIEKSLKNGSLVQTGGLAPSAQGTRARLAGGKVTVTDGPFTEAKEVIGGGAGPAGPPPRAAGRGLGGFLGLPPPPRPGGRGGREVRPGGVPGRG